MYGVWRIECKLQHFIEMVNIDPVQKKLIGAPSYYRNDIADAYSLSGSNAKTYHHLHVRLQTALKPHLSTPLFKYL